MAEGRSLAETPTWSVATVTTAMVFVCLLVERCIHCLGKWLKKTKQLMLLGLISLMLSQTARWISEFCVPYSLFSRRFFACSDRDVDYEENWAGRMELGRTELTSEELKRFTGNCPEHHEPFVSFEGLEQLHQFLFILGITHVLYSFATVALSMAKIYSWRKWEDQSHTLSTDDLQGNSRFAAWDGKSRWVVPCLAHFSFFCDCVGERFESLSSFILARRSRMLKRQSTFVFHHASHPWSKHKILIWMLCFIRQFRGSITKSDYLVLRLGFIANHKLPPNYNFHKYMVRGMEDEFHGSVGISWPLWIYVIVCIFVNIHGLNIYFYLSFVPAILVMLVGTKLHHVVALLALGVVEATGPFVGTQLKPRDDLFWFGNPEFLVWLVQFISFQNAFEMATFIWSLWQVEACSCLIKGRLMIVIRLLSGLLVQFWCSYSTLPLNVIITQMGSKFKKSLIAESIRESLHSWCRRVKEKSRHQPSLSITSTCSLESSLDIMTMPSLLDQSECNISQI